MQGEFKGKEQKQKVQGKQLYLHFLAPNSAPDLSYGYASTFWVSNVMAQGPGRVGRGRGIGERLGYIYIYIRTRILDYLQEGFPRNPNDLNVRLNLMNGTGVSYYPQGLMVWPALQM